MSMPERAHTFKDAFPTPRHPPTPTHAHWVLLLQEATLLQHQQELQAREQELQRLELVCVGAGAGVVGGWVCVCAWVGG